VSEAFRPAKIVIGTRHFPTRAAIEMSLIDQAGVDYVNAQPDIARETNPASNQGTINITPTARTVANIERTPIETFLAQLKAGTADEAGLIAAVVYAIRAATTTR
jgi:hypothetical protein